MDIKGEIFVDKINEFSWTLLVNSPGHFCPRHYSFWLNFHEHFWGEFSWADKLIFDKIKTNQDQEKCENF